MPKYFNEECPEARMASRTVSSLRQPYKVREWVRIGIEDSRAKPVHVCKTMKKFAQPENEALFAAICFTNSANGCGQTDHPEYWVLSRRCRALLRTAPCDQRMRALQCAIFARQLVLLHLLFPARLSCAKWRPDEVEHDQLAQPNPCRLYTIEDADTNKIEVYGPASTTQLNAEDVFDLEVTKKISKDPPVTLPDVQLENWPRDRLDMILEKVNNLNASNMAKKAGWYTSAREARVVQALPGRTISMVLRHVRASR
ncbi:hypothetical protein CYLTODRAFT_414145 [Cylindrobasidium torrendii FP15055 ss-10]|uniref:Uncharacterized protein n=1 Tax=Cylindrobasidium torrendii FP15055 ss-10 TaxID=1314674 RepID=A0A0D7AYH1_9AGAR|nr:hypothetical protein CYLTODRAFT_414145 [Cylindrobasidium torrendii FP15055 ss-10]